MRIFSIVSIILSYEDELGIPTRHFRIENQICYYLFPVYCYIGKITYRKMWWVSKIQ